MNRETHLAPLAVWDAGQVSGEVRVVLRDAVKLHVHGGLYVEVDIEVGVSGWCVERWMLLSGGC